MVLVGAAGLPVRLLNPDMRTIAEMVPTPGLAYTLTMGFVLIRLTIVPTVCFGSTCVTSVGR
jgi:hypothetical protein